MRELFKIEGRRWEGKRKRREKEREREKKRVRGRERSDEVGKVVELQEGMLTTGVALGE